MLMCRLKRGLLAMLPCSGIAWRLSSARRSRYTFAMDFWLEAAAWTALILVGLLVLLALAWWLVARHFARRLVRPRLASMAQTRQQAIDEGVASAEFLAGLHLHQLVGNAIDEPE